MEKVVYLKYGVWENDEMVNKEIDFDTNCKHFTTTGCERLLSEIVTACNDCKHGIPQGGAARP